MGSFSRSGVGKHGHWEPIDGFQGYAKKFRCTVCSGVIELDDWVTSKYVGVKICPICGADNAEEGRQCE